MGWPQNVSSNDSKQPVADEVGKRLKIIYENLLEGFERDTVQTTIDNTYRQRQTAPPVHQNAQATGPTANANGGLQTFNLSASVGQIVPSAPPALANMPAQNCLRLALIAAQPIEELQKKNLPGDALKHILEHKVFLQNFLQYCQNTMKKQQTQQQLIQAHQAQQQVSQGPSSAMNMPAEQAQSSFPNKGPFLANGSIALVDIGLIKQEAMSRPEVYQQAFRRIGILKESTRHSLPDTGSKGIPNEEHELFKNIFARLLKLHQDVESLLPAYMIFVKEEQHLQSVLKMVRAVFS